MYLALEYDFRCVQDGTSSIFALTDKLHFSVNAKMLGDILTWQLECACADTQPWRQPPAAVLEAVAKLSISAGEREGSPSELARAINARMAVNRLTRHLNVNTGRLLDEHQVKYEFKTKHEGRRIRLTHVPVIVKAYEVTA